MKIREGICYVVGSSQDSGNTAVYNVDKVPGPSRVYNLVLWLSKFSISFFWNCWFMVFTKLSVGNLDFTN